MDINDEDFPIPELPDFPEEEEDAKQVEDARQVEDAKQVEDARQVEDNKSRKKCNLVRENLVEVSEISQLNNENVAIVVGNAPKKRKNKEKLATSTSNSPYASKLRSYKKKQ